MLIMLSLLLLVGVTVGFPQISSYTGYYPGFPVYPASTQPLYRVPPVQAYSFAAQTAYSGPPVQAVSYAAQPVVAYSSQPVYKQVPVYSVPHLYAAQPEYTDVQYSAPVYSNLELYSSEDPRARNFVNAPGFTTVKGVFAKNASLTISGNMSVSQNIINGPNAIFSANLNSANSVKGLSFQLAYASNCTGNATNIDSPITLPEAAPLKDNNFSLVRTSNTTNLDGTMGRTNLTGKFILIRVNGTTVGCTKEGLKI